LESLNCSAARARDAPREPATHQVVVLLKLLGRAPNGLGERADV